jgi:hypothetical protein
MPHFRGVVTAYGYLTVEAADMYEADEIARNMSTDEIMQRVERLGFETFPDEFPEEI